MLLKPLFITRTPVLQDRTPTFIKQESLGPLNFLTDVKPCISIEQNYLKQGKHYSNLFNTVIVGKKSPSQSFLVTLQVPRQVATGPRTAAIGSYMLCTTHLYCDLPPSRSSWSATRCWPCLSETSHRRR